MQLTQITLNVEVSCNELRISHDNFNEILAALFLNYI